MKVHKAKLVSNSWSRWHPRSYLVPYVPPKNVKGWEDPTSEIGDIIEYSRAGLIRFFENAIECPFCHEFYFKRNALARHLYRDEFWSKKEIDVFIENLEEEVVEVEVSKVSCYYQAILPKKIPILPARRDVDLTQQIPKGTKPPTPAQREAYDRTMKVWRRELVEKYEEREPTLSLLPNGEYWEKTGDIYVWLPQVLIEGVWVRPDNELCRKWNEIKLKKRVLTLISIQPEG